MIWEYKVQKETGGLLEFQVSQGLWAIQAQKDQRDRKAVWGNLAWRESRVREDKKVHQGLVVNQDPLGLERKETEVFLVTQVLTAPLVCLDLLVPKVPWVPLDLRVLQVLLVSKASEEKLVSLVPKVREDQWDPQDPKGILARKDLEVSQENLA